MKYFFLYLLFCTHTFSQNIFFESASDSVPPFNIGNKWLFNVEEINNNVSISYKMTKEIVDTLTSTKFVINTKKYIEGQIIDSTEYWIWEDSSYRQCPYMNICGAILYKIGQEDYYINQGVYTWRYTNIIDTIFNIITEGSIYNYNFFINLCYTSYTTKFGLKVGLYEVSSSFACDVSNWSTFEQLLGVRINGIVYGDTTYLVTCITDPIKISKNFDLFQN